MRPSNETAPALAPLCFELPGRGHALFTTRAEGNLSTVRGPGYEHGRRERDRLCEALGLRWLCASRQVHGAVVERVSTLTETGTDQGDTRSAEAGGCSPLGSIPTSASIHESASAEGACLPASVGREAVAIDADGHATALRGVGAMVLVADCLPVVLGSEGAVAALHAGWRGLAAGVLEEGVRAVRELGGKGDVVAVIGPGAGPCCYEVGEEVHAAFAADPSGLSRREGRNLDLPGLARVRLEAAGIAQVEHVGGCTICDQRYFSHRREGPRAGRQAGVAWLS